MFKDYSTCPCCGSRVIIDYLFGEYFVNTLDLPLENLGDCPCCGLSCSYMSSNLFDVQDYWVRRVDSFVKVES